MLLATVVAHGTNLGLDGMGQSAERIATDMLQHVSHWFLRESTLKAANAALVNHHHQMPLSPIWGTAQDHLPMASVLMFSEADS